MSHETTRGQARYVLLACIMSSSLVGMDSMMTTVALPSIAEDLDAGMAAQQWVVAAFLLAMGSLLLVGGALGDVYDRWLVFGAGTAGFGIAALLSALAPNVPVLIAGRLLQGVAAALMVPGALAVITESFSGAERAKAIGTWTAWSSLSILVSPLLGGVLADAFSWRAVYGTLIPLTAVVVYLIVRAAPRGARRTKGGSIDRGGALLGIPVVGGPVFALIQSPRIGWTHPLVLGALAVAVLSIVAFLWWERRQENPLLPLPLFRNRSFTVLNVVTFVLYGALISSGVYTVLFLQQTAGYSSAAAGVTAAVPIVVLFFLSSRFGSMADRYGPRPFVGGGALLAGAGILLLLRADSDADLFGAILPSVLLHGLGLSMLVAPLTAGVLASATDGHAGAASAVNNAVARIGSLLAVALVGMLISLQFSEAVDSKLEGQQLSPAAQRAVGQAEEKPLSTETADGLPPAERQLLERVMSEASVDAFRLGVTVIGGLALLAAVLAAVGIGARQSRFAASRCPGGTLAGAHRDVAHLSPQPEPVR